MGKFKNSPVSVYMYSARAVSFMANYMFSFLLIDLLHNCLVLFIMWSRTSSVSLLHGQFHTFHVACDVQVYLFLQFPLYLLDLPTTAWGLWIERMILDIPHTPVDKVPTYLPHRDTICLDRHALNCNHIINNIYCTFIPKITYTLIYSYNTFSTQHTQWKKHVKNAKQNVVWLHEGTLPRRHKHAFLPGLSRNHPFNWATIPAYRNHTYMDLSFPRNREKIAKDEVDRLWNNVLKRIHLRCC